MPSNRRSGPRLLPRTGARVRWPARAHRAGLTAVVITLTVLVLGWILARFSPDRFLRLMQTYRSLPVTVVAIALMSGVLWFAVDSLRTLLTAALEPADPDRWRRRLLLGAVGVWLALTLAAAAAMLIPAVAGTFGTLG